jgi:DNA-binding NarL/FixJ family response regulator
MSHPPPTCVILEDHDIVRVGLEMLISASGRLRLVAMAGSVAECERLVASSRPDLVISDMSVSDCSGLTTIARIVRAQQGRRVLVLSMLDEVLYGPPALALGANGYVMKDAPVGSLLDACAAVLRGQRWCSPRLLQVLQERRFSGAQPLSARELQVLEQLRTGSTSKEVATALGISERTVDVHRANLKRKLGLRTGADLIAFSRGGAA